MASCSGTSKEYTLTLEYNQGPQNIAANTSVVYWSLVFRCGQYYYQNQSTSDNFQAWVNGTCVYNQNRVISFPGKYQTIVIAEGSATVTHNSDGSKTIGTSALYRPGKTASYYPGNIDCSGSLPITAIPRASVLGSVNFSNFWSTFNATYTKYYAGFTCKLRISYPTISVIQTFDNYGSGNSVALSNANQNAIMDKLISSGSVQLGFVIETWSGGTKIGESAEKIITISKPTINQISNVSDFDVDSGFTITTSKSYPSYTSAINVMVAGVMVFTSSNIASSYKVVFSSAQLNQIYNAMKTVNTTIFTISITSYYGSSNCGSVSTTRTGSITNAAPTLSNFSWQTINNLALHDNQTIIKGKSNVKVTIQQAVAYKGATISYYQVTIGNVTSKVTGLETILNNCDDKIVIVRAIDSRNNVATIQKTCTKFINYTNTTLESLSYIRGSGGIGSEVTADFNGSMFIGDFGLQSNKITATYFFKEVNAKEYTQGTTAITPLLNAKYKNVVAIRGDLGANGFSVDKNFHLKVTVSDELSSYTREIVIAKGTPAIAIHENGVSFGSFYDESIGGVLQANNITIGDNKVIGVLGYKYNLGVNVNLNNLTQEGYYHQATSANASTALNYPTTIAGLLTVVNRSYIYQTYQTITSNSDIYFRSYYNGTWYPWKKAVSTDIGVIANMTAKGGYLGFDSATGDYLRTPANGLLPNVSVAGGTGYIGTSGWRFSWGYFNSIDISATATINNANLSGNIINSNFYRSTGNTGWYSNTYGGGIYMKDSSYVRVYGDKHFLTGGELHAGGAVYMGGLRCMRTSDGHIDAMGWGNSSRSYIHVATSHGAYGINVWASDKSLKEHIKDTKINHALDKVSQLEHVSFNWKDGNGHCELGYVADDMEKVLPCLIHEVEQKEDETNVKPKTLKHINHTTLLPLVTMGMQELIQENKYLWQFNNAVVDEVCIMKKEIEELKKLVIIEGEVK